MNVVYMLDYDGVLVDSLDYFHRGLREAAQELGYHQFDEREPFLRLFDHNMFDGMLKAGVCGDSIPMLMQTLARKLSDVGVYACFPGIPEILHELAERGTVYVITSNLSSVVERYFDAIGVRVVKEVLGSDKDPSKIRKIRGVMNRDPEAVYYYIGDTEGDMREGREAGATTVGVLWGWHRRAQLEQAHPDILVECPSDLKRLCPTQATC